MGVLRSSGPYEMRLPCINISNRWDVDTIGRCDVHSYGGRNSLISIRYLLRVLDYGDTPEMVYMVLPMMGMSLKEAVAYDGTATFTAWECRELSFQIAMGIECK